MLLRDDSFTGLFFYRRNVKIFHVRLIETSTIDFSSRFFNNLLNTLHLPAIVMHVIDKLPIILLNEVSIIDGRN